MTTPISPKLLKGGLVLLDPDSGRLLRTIPLQYNPDSLNRSFQVQAVEGSESGGRSQPLRLKGPPVETIKLDAEIDATDALAAGDAGAAAIGVQAHLAALETLVYPDSARLVETDRLLGQGVMEVAPIESPLTLFVWSRDRVLPVRVTELSVTEEAFDANLNPIRAKVSLGLRVLSTSDVGFSHRGGTLFLAHLRLKEAWARRQPGGLAALGLEGVP
jgi:hypothetical protein